MRVLKGNASVNSSRAHLPYPPGNRGAFAHVVSLEGGAFAILLWPGGWALTYPGATTGHFDTRIFDRWLSLSGRMRQLGELLELTDAQPSCQGNPSTRVTLPACKQGVINRTRSVCMGECLPRSCGQTSLRSVCTYDLGQGSPIQTSCSVKKS